MFRDIIVASLEIMSNLCNEFKYIPAICSGGSSSACKRYKNMMKIVVVFNMYCMKYILKFITFKYVRS